MKQKISTKLGTVVLVVIALTAILFVWKYESVVDAQNSGPDMMQMN